MSIYLQHFALKREPFSIVPDPGFLYPSHQHRQAVAHLKYGLDREGGFILLTGEVGTGKTTLTRTMLQRIPAHVRVAYVLNSKLNETDLLASICHELSIKLPKNKDLSFSKICIDALNQNLLASHAEGKKTLIVIEEAQNLSNDVLETLRLLSNLETNTQKLLHILLVAQPELIEILGQQDLRQLNQRVVSRFHLLPLDKAEVVNYINHRLHHAGASAPIFDAGCISAIFKLTKGVPRLINLICHQALVAAYSLGNRKVSAALVKDAASEIMGDLGDSEGSNKPMLGLLVLTLVALVSLNVPLFKQMISPYLVTDSVLTTESGGLNIEEPEVIEQEVLAATAVTLPANLQDSEGVVPEKEADIEVITEEPFLVKQELIQESVSVLTNPLVSLFALWGVEAPEVYTFEELSALAEDNGLRAETLGQATIYNLTVVDRPGIVVLQKPSGLAKSQMLINVDESTVYLLENGEIVSLDKQIFEERWTGTYVYLWQPPKDFLVLQAGDINKPALSWLQAKLGELSEESSNIISGGRYTEAVQQQVTEFQRQQNILADGIVGHQTLMRLNQLTDQKIPRLVGTDN